ncbi:MAG: hypothetical protein ACI9OJ_004554, partial [Myxococcota bacterium]
TPAATPAAKEAPAKEAPAKAKPAEAKPAEAKPAEAKPAYTTIVQPKGTPVAAREVGKSGTRFDPPIAKAQVPEGAWYCDMGTVHYGQMHEGDGTCPLCKMKLVHKAPAPE